MDDKKDLLKKKIPHKAIPIKILLAIISLNVMWGKLRISINMPGIPKAIIKKPIFAS